MAYNAKKTEHPGPKKGHGAFYGRKADAKTASKRRRREEDKRAVKSITDDYIRNMAGMAGTKGKLLKALMGAKAKEREL
jgi:hypothetical protein